MEFIDLMSEKTVTLLKSNQKTEAIIELAALAGDQGMVDDVDDLTEKLFYREQLMSTGLGLGLGIPHVRYTQTKKPGILVGVQPRGIHDYDSIDNEPVKVVVMIILKEGDQRLHIRLLSQIVPLFKDMAVMDALIKVEDSAAIWEIFRNALLGEGDK